MMNFLLDTHTFLWLINEQYSSKLSEEVNRLFLNQENQFNLSIASVWEMAIKVQMGKLDIAQPIGPFILEQLQENEINLFDIRFQHAIKVAELPLHHRDPFDRLIIAQSLVENIPILSKDKIFDAYGIQRIW
jgi:PIN domain nuclease of toxin-antitoxin system